MKSKRALETPINVIIIAIICLVVLVVVLAIFSGRIGEVGKSFADLTKKSGEQAEQTTTDLDELFGFSCKEGTRTCAVGDIAKVCRNGKFEEIEDCSKTGKKCKDGICQ